MSKKTIFTSLIAISIIFSACSNGDKNTEDANSIIDKQVIKKAKTKFELTSIQGKKYIINKKNDGFILEGAKDKVIILDIFATWCPPCRAEASHLASLQKKYKDNLVIIGITIEKGIPNDKLETFQHEYDADYVLVNSQENAELVSAVTKSLNMSENFGIPLMVMYKDAKLVQYYQGATEEEFIESDIKKAAGI
jgi:thiol-disulfide isomerase/thioredoxin